ncbi:minor capsid protein [Pectobacterium brasiliense]|uniref:phage head morphogenesis protein n=1 Tax=Pectobacterium brasiliense TaxID=180957 RepID=UPI000CE68ACD|nr:phage minor head protein [Pectobacterium brasiliense]MBN3045313.1 minor capsid protein [Pectobacterium brasiliense]MBN3182993.1 minor capsid protein [Pectobacterium brasiliense]PPE64362.1 phage head morphogenesis protein [Pectobacterium brasiliense]
MPTPNDVNLGYAIGLKPEEAIRYFESKGYVIGFNWHDVEARAHATAFTVAGVLKQDVLADIRGGLDAALKNGETLEQFRRRLTPVLEQKGWLGKGLKADEDGVLEGKKLTPRRLKTIFETNMQAAYNAGRYEEQLANAEFRPYLERVAVMDTHTRPVHARLNGYTARIDDPVWQFMYPPDGHVCRCRVRGRSQADVDRLKITVQHSEIVEVEQAWGPNDSRIVNAIKWNGELYTPDAGFGHNPSQGYLASLGQRLLERSSVADPQLAALAVRQTMINETLLKAVSTDVNAFVNNTLLNQQARGQLRHVGALPPKVVDRLAEKGVAVESSVITLTDENLLHAIRDSKDAQLTEALWQRLPEFILNPKAILYNTQKADAALTYVISIPTLAENTALSINAVRSASGSKRLVIDSVHLSNELEHTELLWGELE